MTTPGRWLLLIHHIPPKPDYLRVKTGRQLQRLGAVAIKNSVYALPSTEAAGEHFEWVLREITEGGGEASICEARLVDGLRDAELEDMFRAARDADYAELTSELRELRRRAPKRGSAVSDGAARLAPSLTRIRRRLAEVAAIDFFGASGRETCEALLGELEARVSPARSTNAPERLQRGDYRERIWVTRRGIHVDRMASAWLIRRFVDPDARFKFVAPRGYSPEPGELRFDMFDGEFTHRGDLCTFEVLVASMQLEQPALAAIGEVVHDIDLRDGRFGRPETPGIEMLIAAIAHAHREDEARLERAGAMLDDLYELYRRTKGEPRPVERSPATPKNVRRSR